MLSLPAYDTSGFKSIPQLSSGMTKFAAFNFSPSRASYDSKQLRQTPASIAKHNAALPISRIPTELLCDIFFKFLEDDREFPDYAPVTGLLVSFRSRADPTILGQVCSWWKRVALSTSALWANIFILEPKKPQIFRTRLWLQRAGTHPLNIAIEERRKVGYDLTSLDDILSALASRRQLWRKVDFCIPDDAVKKLMVAITSQPFNFWNLESASLCTGYQQSSQKASVDTIWKAFHSSPVLHEVDWRGAYYNELPTHAPWVQLTHLDLQSEFDAESLAGILASCSQIRLLTIFRLSLPSRTTQLVPLILESLHTLTLEAAIKTGSLFERLTLPSLRSLDIRHRYIDEDFTSDFVPFQEFLARSNCSLEKFAFYDEDFEEDDLQAYLSSPNLQYVTALKLQVPISDKTIESFIRQTADGPHEILPFVEEMTLSIHASSDGLLAQMATSRSTDLNAHKGCKPLRKIILHKDGDYGSKDEIGLSTLFNSGLQGFKS